MYVLDRPGNIAQWQTARHSYGCDLAVPLGLMFAVLNNEIASS
jgi:hypothetical protein